MTQNYLDLPSPPASQKRLTSTPTLTTDCYDRLDGLIHHIPSTTSILTSSVEHLGGAVWWVVGLWSLSVAKTSWLVSENDSDDTLTSQAKGGSMPQDDCEGYEKIQDRNGDEQDIENEEGEEVDVYDEHTRLLFIQAIQEARMVVQAQQSQERKRNAKIEMKTFRKLMFNPSNPTHIDETPSVDSLVHAWTFGKISLDFEDDTVKVIIQTDQGDLVLLQDANNQHKSTLHATHKEDTVTDPKKDELSYWFAKFLEHVRDHPVSSIPIRRPMRGPKFDLNPLPSAFRNAINTERRKMKDFKRKYDEMMNQDIDPTSSTEEEVDEQQKSEERWKKVNEWMESHFNGKKHKEQKRIELERKTIWERLKSDQEKSKAERRKVDGPRQQDVIRPVKLSLFVGGTISDKITRSRSRDVVDTIQQTEETGSSRGIRKTQSGTNGIMGSESSILKKKKSVHLDASAKH
ncbi:hypothetical protein L486_03652 [Kwoniella mangroviensis CBS 10435]|uniref:Uncharacterized protein n=1 Tax=Kwoniella mangroviensis CBS 10435 TaxID=1331196 RepID=A0A1B9IUD4_9TREE|nr:hypothetical protein L486_03652 [Kwoniella mangroviensis CBS 10435]